MFPDNILKLEKLIRLPHYELVLVIENVIIIGTEYVGQIVAEMTTIRT